MTESLVDGDEVRAPVASIQPVASAELAAILARAGVGDPRDAIVEVAGHERMSFAELARVVLDHQRRDMDVVEDATATYFRIPVGHSSLVPSGDAELGTTPLAAWLAQR